MCGNLGAQIAIEVKQSRLRSRNILTAAIWVVIRIDGSDLDSIRVQNNIRFRPGLICGLGVATCGACEDGELASAMALEQSLQPREALERGALRQWVAILVQNLLPRGSTNGENKSWFFIAQLYSC